MAILDVVRVQQARADLLDKAETLQALAQEENRELTEDEVEDFDGWLKQHAAMQADEDRAADFAERLRKAQETKAAAHPPVVVPVAQPASEKPPAKIPATARVTNRLKAFKTEEDAYDAGMWFKAELLNDSVAQQYCRDREIFRADAQTYDDADKGAKLVPTTIAASIITVREEAGVARRLSTIIPMTSEAMTWPKRTSGQTVYYPGEATAITASEAVWGQVSLTAVKRAILTKVSYELLQGSVVDVAEYLAQEIGFQLAWQEDNEWVNGDGTSTYGGETGLVSALGAAGTNTLTATTYDTWPELVLAQFDATMALLPGKWWGRGPSWLMSHAFYAAVVLRLLSAAGGNTIRDIEEGGRPQLQGYPINFTDRMPTATAVSTVSALFGAFPSASIIGDRAQILLSTSDERYFDEDVIALKATTRYDINVHEPGDGSTAGAYVGLKTGSAT